MGHFSSCFTFTVGTSQLVHSFLTTQSRNCVVEDGSGEWHQGKKYHTVSFPPGFTPKSLHLFIRCMPQADITKQYTSVMHAGLHRLLPGSISILNGTSQGQEFSRSLQVCTSLDKDWLITVAYFSVSNVKRFQDSLTLLLNICLLSIRRTHHLTS